MERLAEKVAIVTGAATGIGRETACLFAEEGARVVVADVREREADETVDRIRRYGGEAFFVKTDVSNGADVRALVDEAETQFGSVHIMVANAGIMGRGHRKTLVEITEEEFREIMAVNCDGVWLSFKYAIPAILRAGGGAMTATASVAGLRGNATFPAYCASKSAVLGIVRSVAADVGPTIRVNAVAPGAVRTEISAHTAEAKGLDPAQGVGIPEPELIGEARDVAHAHLYLVSDEARFVQGQALVVDGGRTSQMR
jgi:NAD(P)-dependent dehydrogenase (short-subunit alcohol dehydrogenase family)